LKSLASDGAMVSAVFLMEVELPKDVPYSVARRHQQLLCGYLQGSFFTYDDLESGPCKAIYQATCTCIFFCM